MPWTENGCSRIPKEQFGRFPYSHHQCVNYVPYVHCDNGGWHWAVAAFMILLFSPLCYLPKYVSVTMTLPLTGK